MLLSIDRTRILKIIIIFPQLKLLGCGSENCQGALKTDPPARAKIDPPLRQKWVEITQNRDFSFSLVCPPLEFRLVRHRVFL